MTNLIPKRAIELSIEGGWESKRDFMRKPQEWFLTHYETYDNSYYAWVYTKPTKASYCARVEIGDLDLVSKYRWYIKSGYAVTSIGGKRVKMHHLILGVPQAGFEVDHINHDKMDNRRSNLRIVAANDNKKNQEGKGYRKRGNRYEAYIGLNGKQKSLGSYDTAVEAHAAYKRAQQERINSIAV